MNDQSTGRGKNKEGRSPGYPAIDLPTALERARIIMDEEKRNFANVATILKHWSYGPKSSQGLLVLAALKKFGLLEDEGVGEARKMKLTDLAWRILIDNREESKERLEAIQEAALRPHIHRQIWDEYPEGLPSDDNLRFRLQMEWKPRFTSSAVDGFIAEFRRTIAFAKLGKGDILSGHEEDKTPCEEERNMPATSDTRQPEQPSPLGSEPELAGLPAQEFKLALSEGQFAYIKVPHSFKLSDWEKIDGLLKVLKPN